MKKMEERQVNPMKRFRMLIAAALCAVMVAGCGKSAPLDATGAYPLSSGEATINDEELHTDFVSDDQNRVFYQIFVGSFSDSDGDGVGDLRGIINRMDYLNDGDHNSGLSLGVEGIWLTPVFASPSYHKYDVTDYYAIDPAFGTEEDLVELAELCHQRNVKLIIDLVINHTGDRNKWFSQFKEAHFGGKTDDPYYNFYHFYTKGDPTPAGGYAQLMGTQDYYECNFSGSMPELNYDNPDVRQAMVDVAKYWLDRGVDGFRFDAAKYIYFGDNVKSAAFWDWYMAQLRAIKPDIYTVAEVWDSEGIANLYTTSTNCFNFAAAQSGGIIAETAQAGDVNRFTSYVEKYIGRLAKIRSDAVPVLFLTNHDMDRAAGFLTVASGRMQMAANLYLLSPGSPFIYYGEELGMRGSRGGANTDANRRLAMVWGDGDTVANPEGTSYGGGQVEQTAADQKGDAASLYNYYKRLLMIRAANPAIARGEYHALTFEGTKLGGFTATYDGTTVCVLHNTSGSPVTVDLSAATDLAFTDIRARVGLGSATLEGTTLTLDAQTSVVLGQGNEG